MECRLLRIHTQYWRWNIIQVDSSYLMDAKDSRRQLVRHPLVILDLSVCSPVLWTQLCPNVVRQSMYLSRNSRCIYRNSTLICSYCSCFKVGFSSSLLREHACAVGSSLALGTVVGKPNLQTTIRNWTAVYVCCDALGCALELLHVLSHLEIRRMDEQNCTQHDMIVQAPQWQMVRHIKNTFRDLHIHKFQIETSCYLLLSINTVV